MKILPLIAALLFTPVAFSQVSMSGNVIVGMPGPQGPAGTNGTNGTNGVPGPNCSLSSPAGTCDLGTNKLLAGAITDANSNGVYQVDLVNNANEGAAIHKCLTDAAAKIQAINNGLSTDPTPACSLDFRGAGWLGPSADSIAVFDPAIYCSGTSPSIVCLAEPAGTACNVTGANNDSCTTVPTSIWLSGFKDHVLTGGNSTTGIVMRSDLKVWGTGSGNSGTRVTLAYDGPAFSTPPYRTVIQGLSIRDFLLLPWASATTNSTGINIDWGADGGTDPASGVWYSDITNMQIGTGFNGFPGGDIRIVASGVSFQNVNQWIHVRNVNADRCTGCKEALYIAGDVGNSDVTHSEFDAHGTDFSPYPNVYIGANVTNAPGARNVYSLDWASNTVQGGLVPILLQGADRINMHGEPHYEASVNGIMLSVGGSQNFAIQHSNGYFSSTIGTQTAALTSVANASAGTTVYTGTIPAYLVTELATSGDLPHPHVVISGFNTSANNGTFTISAATSTTITVDNTSGTSETTAATASLGFLFDVYGTGNALSMDIQHNRWGNPVCTVLANPQTPQDIRFRHNYPLGGVQLGTVQNTCGMVPLLTATAATAGPLKVPGSVPFSELQGGGGVTNFLAPTLPEDTPFTLRQVAATFYGQVQGQTATAATTYSCSGSPNVCALSLYSQIPSPGVSGSVFVNGSGFAGSCVGLNASNLPVTAVSAGSISVQTAAPTGSGTCGTGGGNFKLVSNIFLANGTGLITALTPLAGEMPTFAMNDRTNPPEFECTNCRGMGGIEPGPDVTVVATHAGMPGDMIIRGVTLTLPDTFTGICNQKGIFNGSFDASTGTPQMYATMECVENPGTNETALTYWLAKRTTLVANVLTPVATFSWVAAGSSAYNGGAPLWALPAASTIGAKNVCLVDGTNCLSGTAGVFFSSLAATGTSAIGTAPAQNATRLLPFYYNGATVSSVSSMDIRVTTADNTANVYDIGVYGPGCNGSTASVPLQFHTGATAGSALNAGATGAFVIAVSGAPVTTTLRPGWYCLAYTSSAVTPSLILGGDGQASYGPFGLTASCGSTTCTTASGVLNSTITSPATNSQPTLARPFVSAF